VNDAVDFATDAVDFATDAVDFAIDVLDFATDVVDFATDAVEIADFVTDATDFDDATDDFDMTGSSDGCSIEAFERFDVLDFDMDNFDKADFIDVTDFASGFEVKDRFVTDGTAVAEVV